MCGRFAGDDDGSGDPTRRWVRAEAVLKATGWGLPGAGGPTPSAPARTSSLDLGPGYEAALAVLTSQHPERTGHPGRSGSAFRLSHSSNRPSRSRPATSAASARNISVVTVPCR